MYQHTFIDYSLIVRGVLAAVRQRFSLKSRYDQGHASLRLVTLSELFFIGGNNTFLGSPTDNLLCIVADLQRLSFVFGLLHLNSLLRSPLVVEWLSRCH